MNSDPGDFETLRKLMALKRHEQPPPGYLNQLSSSIHARLEQGEGRLTMWDRVSANFTLRPFLAYAFGLTVCGAVGLSAVSMVREEMAQAADPSPVATLKTPAHAATFAGQYKSEPPVLHVANWLGNTNPTAETQPRPSLFDTHPTALPAAYESY
jgi:hypothetical protein